MQANKNRIQVSSSALVGLKAALYSKQQDVKREKQTNLCDNSTVTRKVSDKTASIWKSARKKVKVHGKLSEPRQGKATKESAEKVLSQEEENQLEKSRHALEAKAALYERLSRGQGLREVEGQDGEESRYMVDFTKKIYQELKDKEPCASAQDSKIASESAGDSPPPERSQGSEEWVEFVDSFGRTRRCLKGELPEVENLDKHFKEERSPSPQLLSEDMRRERERKRWEKDVEQEIEVDKPVGPVHYQSVEGGEVRSHGVGYYQFSKEEHERKEQMEILDKLRTETNVERDKKQKFQEKRKAMLDARLAKVRERKLKQKKEQGDGIADFDFQSKESVSEKTEETAVSSDDIRSLLDSELERSKEVARLELEKREEEERAHHLRPWDKGKVVDPIRKRKQELEQERQTEFAPPTFYSSEVETKKIKVDKNEHQLLQTSEPSNIVTPPPPPGVTNSNVPVSSQPWFVTLPPPPGVTNSNVPVSSQPWFVTPPPPPGVTNSNVPVSSQPWFVTPPPHYFMVPPFQPPFVTPPPPPGVTNRPNTMPPVNHTGQYHYPPTSQ